jgi:S1-C subfamily serine protease
MSPALKAIVLPIIGTLLAGAAPDQALAQRAPKAPAEVAAPFEPGRLGVELRELTQHSVKALGLAQAHAILVVLPLLGGPAERAGLQPGDVIVELEGVPVGNIDAFTPALQRTGAGKVATLVLLRGGGRITVRAMLGSAADIREERDETERRLNASEGILRMFNREVFPED